MLRFNSPLAQAKREGNLRTLSLPPSPLIDFASNDYLGLARSLELERQMFQEWQKGAPEGRRLGATGSRLLTGNSLYIQELEDKIASFHGYPAGLLFSCGYMANVGLLSALGSPQDLLFFRCSIACLCYTKGFG